MDEVDRKIQEMLEVASLIDERLLKGRSMKDILLADSMKEPLPKELMIPMDFKYRK